MKKMNKKGFTLMEMLIVVAIIAVLVAITIPVMNNSLEKAREATDAANLRAAYAECAIAVLDTEGAAYEAVSMTQTEAGFSKIDEATKIGDVTLKGDSTLDSNAKKGNTIYVVVAADGTCTFATSAPADAKDASTL